MNCGNAAATNGHRGCAQGHQSLDLQPAGGVSTLIESAARLCEADIGHIARPTEAGYFQSLANYGFTERAQGGVRAHAVQGGAGKCDWPRSPGAHGSPYSRCGNRSRISDEHEIRKLGGYRSMLGVPLMREGTPIGVIAMARYAARPFTAKRMELITTFADQAVIAIENARLFDAEQARTRELAEALEQQTATADVLRVISSSPGDLEPVFQAMLANAVRICDASFGVLFRFEDGAWRAAAMVECIGICRVLATRITKTGATISSEPSRRDQADCSYHRCYDRTGLYRGRTDLAGRRQSWSSEPSSMSQCSRTTN